MARFAQQYVREDLEWTPEAAEAWQPAHLAKQELDLIRKEVQYVLAAMTCATRQHTLTDRRQLAQALAHLRTMRRLWTALLIPGTLEPDGEHKLPPAALRQGATFNVRDWSFARQRRAEAHRAQYVTLAWQKNEARHANRIATYYNTDIRGLLAIFGK